MSNFMAYAVSIHAPAWGATNTRIVVDKPIIVSIHAPAWGATGPAMGEMLSDTRFNPRARVGRDLEIWSTVNAEGVFQSTRPRGARRYERPRNSIP